MIKKNANNKCLNFTIVPSSKIVNKSKIHRHY
jgi:hypothetical protein